MVKWDAEPVSLPSLGEALARGWRIATTPPMGPVYVGVDILMQEADATDLASWPVPGAIAPVTAPRAVVEQLADALVRAETPTIVVDRGAPGLSAPLTQLAEQLGIAVVDLGGRTLATTHWAEQTPRWEDALAVADLVLAVELRDVAWGLTRVDLSDRSTVELPSPNAHVVSIGLTELRHSGYMTIEGLSPGIERVTAEPTTFFTELLAELSNRDVDDAAVANRRQLLADDHARRRADDRALAENASASETITPAHVARTLGELIEGMPVQVANGLLAGWPRRLWDMRDESSYLGRSGGEGLGYGLPASLGAALAQRDNDDLLIIDLQSDGDLMYTPQALWTAAHHELPVLIVVHNNRSYGKDEMHQAEVAKARGRTDYTEPPDGIRLENPDIDYAAMARAQGVEGIGPVVDPAELAESLKRALEVVRTTRRPCLVDVVSSQSLEMSGTFQRGVSAPR